MDNFSIQDHNRYMKIALNLAIKGRGKVSPNPMVGCIIVKDGNIIGEGFHEKFGESLNLMLEGDVDIKKIKEFLKLNLKAFHVPRKIFSCPQFVQTENGKINRVKTIESTLNP